MDWFSARASTDVRIADLVQSAYKFPYTGRNTHADVEESATDVAFPALLLVSA